MGELRQRRSGWPWRVGQGLQAGEPTSMRWLDCRSDLSLLPAPALGLSLSLKDDLIPRWHPDSCLWERLLPP